MNFKFLVVALLLTATAAFATGETQFRNGIINNGAETIGGTTSANAAAILDVQSTTRGFAQPRMTTTQMNAIVSPIDGLTVYNTSLHLPYAYENGAWVAIGSGGTGNGISYGTDSGVANAYVVNPSTALGSYVAGVSIAFSAANANTGASTINVSGLGVVNLDEPAGGATVPGDILTGQLVTATYDGTKFQLISPQGPAVAANTANTTVKRDASGNFLAGTITAALTGHASVDLQIASNLSDVANRQTALNNILGSVASGDYLRCDGTNCSIAAIQAGDVPTLNQSTTGNAATATALAASPTGCSGGQFTTGIGANGNASCATPSGTGVTAVSVATTNGFSGSSSGGTTPALTITTTISGLIKGVANALAAAVAGTDYVIPSGSITGTAGNVTGIVGSANGGSGLNNSAATGIQTFAAGTGIVSSFTSAFINLWETVATSAGDLIYGGSGGTPTRLAVGAAGTSLVVNSGATAEIWSANPAPAVVSLGTCTTSMSVDWSTGQQFTVMLTNGDTCAFTFSNTTGRTITIDFYQPSSGGGTGVASWSSVLWPLTTTPTITTGNSATDTITFKNNGIDTRGSAVQAF